MLVRFATRPAKAIGAAPRRACLAAVGAAGAFERTAGSEAAWSPDGSEAAGHPRVSGGPGPSRPWSSPLRGVRSTVREPLDLDRFGRDGQHSDRPTPRRLLAWVRRGGDDGPRRYRDFGDATVAWVERYRASSARTRRAGS